jgi:hypothetical protein
MHDIIYAEFGESMYVLSREIIHFIPKSYSFEP